MPDTRKLPVKQRLFLKEWAIDKNASEAYKRAYHYKGKRANCLGPALYAKLGKAGFIEPELQSQEATLIITAQEVLTELKRLMTVDPAMAFDKDGNLLSIHNIPEDVRRAIAAFDVSEDRGTIDGAEKSITTRTIKVKFWDKNAAITTAARSLQMLVDKINHSGVVTMKSLLTDKGINLDD